MRTPKTKAEVVKAEEEQVLSQNQSQEKNLRDRQWFDVGWDEMPEKRLIVPRYWIPVGQSRQIIFVDENPFRFYEHQWKSPDGNWRNYAVCLQGIAPLCPMCEANFKSYYVGCLTVVDLHPWTDKEGKVHSKTLRLFAAKSEVLKSLKIRKDKYGLAGKLYTVTRLTDKSPNTGDDFLFEGEADWGKLGFDKPPAPFDYKSIFIPMTVKEMQRIVSRILAYKENVAKSVAQSFGEVEEEPEDEVGDDEVIHY